MMSVEWFSALVGMVAVVLAAGPILKHLFKKINVKIMYHYSHPGFSILISNLSNEPIQLQEIALKKEKKRLILSLDSLTINNHTITRFPQIINAKNEIDYKIGRQFTIAELEQFSHVQVKYDLKTTKIKIRK